MIMDSLLKIKIVGRALIYESIGMDVVCVHVWVWILSV